MPGFDLRTNCPINSRMSEFNLHLSPLTFTLAFPFIIGDILAAKFNKIRVTESELDCEHRWRDDVWCWSVQGRKLLLKTSARTEFLLFKTKTPSAQKTISKWISPVLLYPSTTAWLLPLTSQTNPNSSVLSSLSAIPVDQSSCHPSICADCRAAGGAEQHLPGAAGSSWEEAGTHSGYPSKKHLSFQLCSASLPCSCQPGAGLALAASWQLPLQLCGLHRLHLCGDLALWFWGFSPHDRFPKSVVVVIFQVAIKTRVEVKVMLCHKPLKSFFACSAKQTQKTTDVLSWVKSISAVSST